MSWWTNKAGNLKTKHFWAILILVASPMFSEHSCRVMRTCHADKIVKKAINVSCAHGSCGGSAAILLIGSSSNEAGAAEHWTQRWQLRRRNLDTHHTAIFICNFPVFIRTTFFTITNWKLGCFPVSTTKNSILPKLTSLLVRNVYLWGIIKKMQCVPQNICMFNIHGQIETHATNIP